MSSPAFEESTEDTVAWGYTKELLDSQVLGLDLEADSLFRFQEKICLIQITDGTQGVLVDPFSDDIETLSKALLSRAVWMHGADYDMSLMRQAWNDLPVQIWDTQIGARLVGCRKFGYANLVQEFFDVTLSKTSQKANWGQRPLPDKMARYALNDVRYLIPLSQKILARLNELGRMSWFEESCAWERRRGLERDMSREEAWRIKGSGKLDSHSLAFLKAFWEWRENEARKWDRPSFMVAGNKDLLAWVQAAKKEQRIELPRTMRSDRRKRFLSVLEKVKELGEEEWPKRIRAPRAQRDREREKKVDAILEHRESRANELDLEASILGSRAAIEAFVANDSSKLMGWQMEVLNLSTVGD